MKKKEIAPTRPYIFHKTIPFNDIVIYIPTSFFAVPSPRPPFGPPQAQSRKQENDFFSSTASGGNNGDKKQKKQKKKAGFDSLLALGKMAKQEKEVRKNGQKNLPSSLSQLIGLTMEKLKDGEEFDFSAEDKKRRRASRKMTKLKGNSAVVSPAERRSSNVAGEVKKMGSKWGQPTLRFASHRM